MGTCQINGKYPKNVSYNGITSNAMYYGNELVWTRPNSYSLTWTNSNISDSTIGEIKWIPAKNAFYSIFVYYGMIYVRSSATGLANSWSGNSISSGVVGGYSITSWDYYPAIDKFAMVTSMSPYVYFTTSGSSYSSVEVGFGTVNWDKLNVCNNTLYLYDTTRYAYSTNGTTWGSPLLSNITPITTTNTSRTILYRTGYGVYIVTGATTTLTSITSAVTCGVYCENRSGYPCYLWDGTNRYTLNIITNTVTETVPCSYQFLDVFYDPQRGMFFGITSSNVYYSYDGKNWTSTLTGTFYKGTFTLSSVLGMLTNKIKYTYIS